MKKKIRNYISNIIFLLREDYYFYAGSNEVNPYAKAVSKALGFLFPRISDEVDYFLDEMANPPVPFEYEYPYGMERTYYGD